MFAGVLEHRSTTPPPHTKKPPISKNSTASLDQQQQNLAVSERIAVRCHPPLMFPNTHLKSGSMQVVSWVRAAGFTGAAPAACIKMQPDVPAMNPLSRTLLLHGTLILTP